MTELERKEQWSIDFLRTIEANTIDLHLAYSGGKDSDILLHLARKAKIQFKAVYVNTTIDPPGTLTHVKKQGNVTIIYPPATFYQLVERRGLPSTFQRFCCSRIKERFIAQYLITGVRQDESQARKEKNPEPEKCKVYRHGRKGIQYLPILFWTNEDVYKYINEENIQCHPNYYDVNDNFHVERRVGCLGCPLRYDRGRADFKLYPKLVQRWCNALAVYRNSRKKLGTTITNFRDEYENFYHNIHNHRLQQLFIQQKEEPRDYARLRLQQEFNIELTPPKSALEQLMPVQRFF